MKNGFLTFLTLLPFVCGLSASALAAPSLGDVQKGQKIYADHCSACHALDENKYGPLMRGVYGRKAGALAAYRYTPVFKKLSAVTWDQALLDKWLENPPVMTPGTRMAYRVVSASDRADVIAYLKSLSPPLK